MEKVAIIGAGVSGLTCGVCLAEAGYRTTILAKEAGQHTTSAAAGAIWYPYDVEPLAAAIGWSLQTYEMLFQLSSIPASGVSMIELRTFSRTAQIQIPDWAIALGAQLLPPSASSVGAEPTRAAGL
ncbi:MAG: D-amino-acid oxidase, partial [Verrucomicrobiota bacterium]